MKQKLVEVEWLDITNDNEWTEFEDLDKVLTKAKKCRYFSVGYLYSKDDEWVVILTSICGEGDKLEKVSYEIIPSGCVVRVRTVK